jgi:integrase
MLASLAAQLFKTAKNENGLPQSEYVFHGMKSERIHMKAYCNAWNAACFELGFINLSKQTKAGRPVPLYRLHDLRRTRITALLQAGVDIKTIQKQVGHSGAAMTLKYSQPEKEAQQEMAHKINGIDNALNEKAQKRIVELAVKKERLLDVLQGKDVWSTEDVIKLVEEI